MKYRKGLKAGGGGGRCPVDISNPQDAPETPVLIRNEVGGNILTNSISQGRCLNFNARISPPHDGTFGFIIFFKNTNYSEKSTAILKRMFLRWLIQAHRNLKLSEIRFPA